MTNPKYQASSDFDAGMRKALFMMNPHPGAFYWELQTPAFMEGYHYGRSLRDGWIAAKNECLTRLGLGELAVMTLAAANPDSAGPGSGSRDSVNPDSAEPS